jgi:hypothetical protein
VRPLTQQLLPRGQASGRQEQVDAQKSEGGDGQSPRQPVPHAAGLVVLQIPLAVIKVIKVIKVIEIVLVVLVSDVEAVLRFVCGTFQAAARSAGVHGVTGRVAGAAGAWSGRGVWESSTRSSQSVSGQRGGYVLIAVARTPLRGREVGGSGVGVHPHRLLANEGPGPGRIDHLPAAEVDGDVVDAGAGAGVGAEEDQVPRRDRL